MHISEIRIRNFRSIEDLTIGLEKFTAFCGANSCGKSNIFRAIQFAFESDISRNDAQSNLPSRKISQHGPQLSIQIECKLEDVPSDLRRIAGSTASTVKYFFKLTRGGNLTRRLGDVTLSDKEFEQLRTRFTVVYVPPIRDLDGGGLEPFRQLMRSALQRAKGPANVKKIGESAKESIARKGNEVLLQQTDFAKRIR